MQTESQNKMMDGAMNKSADTPTSVKAISPMFNEYFFPGGGRWKPMTVKTLTREEAEEEHRAKREPVNQEETKVEEKKETTNE